LTVSDDLAWTPDTDDDLEEPTTAPRHPISGDSGLQLIDPLTGLPTP
jgi:hypothetical protein